MLQRKKTEDKESSKVHQTSYLISRETQTTTSRTKYTSTGCNSETQTESFEKGCEICLVSNPYTSSTNVLQLKHSKARVLQQFWRGADSRRSFERLRRDFQRSLSEMGLTEKLRIQKEKEQKEREINRRIKPQTREDFHILHQDIGIWRDTEVLAIKSNTCYEKFNHLDLLHKETTLLQAVDRLKRAAHQSLRCDATAAALRRLSEPKKWSLLRQSGFIKVYTPLNITAGKLLVLYEDLIKDSPSFKERVFTLEKIKGEVKGLKKSILSTEFCTLIDRELEMLRRGRTPGAIEGLRKRISLAFHHLMEECSAQHG